MSQRPIRLGDQIREEIAELLARERRVEDRFSPLPKIVDGDPRDVRQ